ERGPPTMKTRLTLQSVCCGLGKRLRSDRFVGAALTLALAGCSSDDRHPGITMSSSPSSPAPALAPSAANTAGEMPGAEMPSEADSAQMGSAPTPASASEGVQPADLAMP